ncbi:MAG: hypothetical protein PQ612_03555 [Rickettsiales bacterium]|nr:hypothetical protein [Pseudomonadota bacterium]MDA0965812.1 hypothetical protein [Pseudomonadota bacterium]MDG4542718.1 hypothetical protein [Rickettsiales bacterium]MDG4545222.1 hypothetical protein [Rickettsiales bacterium]MDG4547345.1 hypothetical protein [Rickettsiales bacterium]
MSVVLASIAAIIVVATGGFIVLKNTKSNSVLSDIKNVTRAIEQFEEQYDALPGDIANVSNLPNAVSGNGNGVIDTDAEALNLWQHLSTAGMIEGEFDGVSTNIPGKGVPASGFEGGGYKILPSANTVFNSDSDPTNDISEQTIIIALTGFSDSSNDLSVLTPEEAQILDNKADDGKPLEGSILAIGTGDECVKSNGSYNLSNLSASCRLFFLIRKSSSNNEAPDISGSCNAIGQTRSVSDSNKKCPIGYTGKIVETCRVDSDNSGTWEVTGAFCEEVKCTGNGIFGDIRKLSCINGMKGNEGIVEQCTENGVWKVIRSDCEHRTDLSCRTNDEIRPAQACDWGKSGYAMQKCTDNKWGVPFPDNCTEILCGINNIGDTKISSSGCNSNYTGSAIEVCTIAGTWEKTAIGSTCSPVYGTCNASSDSTKNIGCPPGKSGSHILQCIDNDSNDYWTTLSDTCQPIRCSGGENIGSVRIKEGAFCPNGTNGTVMEYCDNNGDWQEVKTNCVIGICEAPADNKGNAYWPTTLGGQTATYTSCTPGYKKVSADPTRNCILNADNTATWSNTVNDECVRITCPEAPTLTNNATYPLTFAGEKNVTGTCDVASGYVAQAPGYPLSDCDMNGNWTNERIPCKNSCPAYEESDVGVAGVKLWLDAADQCMVFSNDSCTINAVAGSDKVGCLKDKSGNDYHAVQPIGSRQPSYTSTASGQNGLPTVRFNGSSNALHYPDIGTFNETTVFAVHKTLSFPDTYNVMFGTSNALNGSSWLYYGTDDGIYLGFETTNRNPLEIFDIYGTTGVYAITSLIDDNINAAIHRDGVVKDSQIVLSPQSKKWGPGTVGGYYEGGSGYSMFFHGNVAEILIYDSGLSTGNKQTVESYLGDKWGIDTQTVFEAATLWYDASDTDTVWRTSGCNAGTKATPGVHTVGCWMDKSGNNFHATQANSSYEPIYTSDADGQNNLPTLKFNGSSTRLEYPDIGEFDKSTVFAIHKESSYSGVGQAIIGASGVSSKSTWIGYKGGTTAPMYFDIRGRNPLSVQKDDYAIAGRYYLTTAYDDNTKSELFRNGSSLVSKNITTDNAKKWGPGSIGAWNEPGYKMFHSGNIGEIIIYDYALSDSERNVINTYLIDKWNITDPDIKDTAVLWLDAEEAATVLKNNTCTGATAAYSDDVGCWKDKSGNDNHAKQGTASKRPKYRSSGINAKPAIDFNRLTFDTLLIPNASGDDFDVNGNFTVMFTLKYDELGNYWGVFFNRGTVYANPFEIGTFKTANVNLWRLYFDIGDGTLDVTDGVESTNGSITTNTDYIFTFRTFGPATTHEIYINGTLNNSRTVPVTASNSGDPVYIGNYDGTTSSGMDGKIGEILFFPSALSITSRKDVESYLSSKWGIPLTP